MMSLCVMLPLGGIVFGEVTGRRDLWLREVVAVMSSRHPWDVDGEGVGAAVAAVLWRSRQDLCGNDEGDERCRRRGFGCDSRLFSGVSVGSPRLVCCCEVEAADDGFQWCTMTGGD